MDSWGAAVSYVLWNHKVSLWLPLKWIARRAYIVLNSLWHCNLVIIWLTDSDWLCVALSFLSLWPCPSVKAYQLSLGLAVCFGWLYKLNGGFKHADWSSCLSELFFLFIHLWRPAALSLHSYVCLHGENSSLACYGETHRKYLQHTFPLNTTLETEITTKATRIRLKWSITMYEEVRYDQARSSLNGG